jgi:hypothetical protein
MDIPDETISQIEQKLEEIADLDPADLPDPAAELAALLNDLLDDMDNT